MGQKISPFALRLGINQDWISRWFTANNHRRNALWIKEDYLIRKFFQNQPTNIVLSKVAIERQNTKIKIFLYSSKIGYFLGQKGKKLQLIQKQIQRLLKNRKYIIRIELIEQKKPALNAQLIANDIANQLVNRQNYKKVQKNSIRSALRLGAFGIKTQVSGRLNGADIARKEGYKEGKLPLSTFRCKIDYGFAEALTTYGQIGVKVWVYSDQTKSPSQ